MAVYVGRWDCIRCGYKGLLGPVTLCTNCGASRPKDVIFYLSPDAASTDDEQAILAAKAGVDWICGHCKRHNKSTDASCSSCENPRDEHSQDINLSEKEYADNTAPTTGNMTRKRVIVENEMKKSRNPIIRILLWLAGLGIPVWGLFTWSSIVDAPITKTIWKRTVQVEHFEPVQRDSWTTPPKEAQNISTSKAIHHYNTVSKGYETKTRTVQEKVGEEEYVCGKIDKGNGYFVDKHCKRPIYKDREETYKEEIFDKIPVYQTKYKFTVKDWTEKEPIVIEEENSTPHNPVSKFPDPDNWRTIKTTTEYWIELDAGNGLKKEEVSERFWQKHKKGTTVKIEKSRLFGTYFGLTED